jgi:hypothetical protein
MEETKDAASEEIRDPRDKLMDRMEEGALEGCGRLLIIGMALVSVACYVGWRMIFGR